jgi:hypothetical protein
MLDVGDERVRVAGHVRAKEARLVCDRVCHDFLREISRIFSGRRIQEI